MNDENENNPTVGFTCGTWDLLHTGHIFFLQECRKNCEIFIVGLHINPSVNRKEKNAPIQSVYERWTQLMSSGIVDVVIPYETEEDLCNILATNDFNIRFLGSDYYNKNITGETLCKERNIDIMFIDRMHNYSSSELRERIFNAELLKRTN